MCQIDDFFKKIGELVDPKTGEIEIGKSSVILNLKNRTESLGELAYWLGMQFETRERTVVVPLSPEDSEFGKLLRGEIGATKVLTPEELSFFSKPKKTRVVFAALSINDEKMADIEEFVGGLKRFKVVIIEYIVAVVIDECDRSQTLKVVRLFDKGNFLS